MAESADKEGRTEEPSEKRLHESIDRGQSPVAREPAVAAALLAVWLVVSVLSGDAARRLSQTLALLLEHIGQVRVETLGDAQAILAALSHDLAIASLPGLLLIGTAGVAASLGQSRNLFAWSRLTPAMQRISPVAGLKRLFGKSNLNEFGRSLLKIAILSMTAWAVLGQDWWTLLEVRRADASTIPTRLAAVISRVLGSVAVAMIAFAILDILIARTAWKRGLRMTKQEVRDEAKQFDGDPVHNARRRAIARSRIRKRLAATVPRATIVIVNPTHYAVALRYVHAEGGAPLVVAKGVDLVALTIRNLAEDCDIPVVENKALARSLHNAVRVDQRIPAEFYRAVADVLIVLQKRGRVRMQPRL